MKKILIIILLIIIFLLSLNNVKGENEKIIIRLQKGNKIIYINDQPLQMDVSPIEIPPGRIMVPVRFVSESMGALVNWDEKTETVIITNDSIPYLKYQILTLNNEIINKDNEIGKLNNLLKEKENKITELEKENEKLKNELKEFKENIYLVKRVIDGDTAELDNGIIVRYIGINAPEQGQSLYNESKQRNKELVEGKKVKLEFDNLLYDQYGRLLSYVFIDDIFVNYQLLKEGFAVLDKIYPNTKYIDKLIEAENYAKENKTGIWKESNIRLKIININYDAEGNDNENLNDEWVEIKNVEIMPVNMKNFTLKDKANHIFTFPEFILNSNEIVKVYSGCGENNLTSLYWCSFGAIWNNDTDTAYLYDSNGNLIDTYNYP
ncbi:MAG TPA: lamin tail domain-containing protein [Caldisericia bacterium]|nr:lamin tail domain-containing protein [Caldisericia bacterium]HQP00177.1 lamin tail domain-containing protein [Caldisericia bacterium]